MTALVPAIDRLVTHLRSQILGGALQPRAPLNQNDLATSFQLNRSQVREALTVLAEERLVLMRAYATAVVAPLSLEEFQELHEIRMALEPMLSRMALPNIPRHHILKMRGLVQLMEETVDGQKWLDANDEFHALLYREANRPWIVEIVDRARRLTSRYTRIHVFELTNWRGDIEHLKILEAIEMQDPQEFERQLIQHMKSGHDMVTEHLAEHPELLDSHPDDVSAQG